MEIQVEGGNSGKVEIQLPHGPPLFHQLRTAGSYAHVQTSLDAVTPPQLLEKSHAPTRALPLSHTPTGPEMRPLHLRSPTYSTQLAPRRGGIVYTNSAIPSLYNQPCTARPGSLSQPSSRISHSSASRSEGCSVYPRETQLSHFPNSAPRSGSSPVDCFVPSSIGQPVAARSIPEPASIPPSSSSPAQQEIPQR